MTDQQRRVLRALQTVGGKGITRVDFQPPNVCDGGDPILNFPARIKELRDDCGYDVQAKTVAGKVEWRDRCKVFVLVKDKVEPLPVLDSPLVLEVGAGTPYDRWAA